MASGVDFALETYDDAFVPATSTQAAGLDQLADGEYEFEIANADMSRTKKSNDLIFKMFIRVLSPGAHQGIELEYPHFIKDQDGVNRIGKELLTLGFDTDLWNPKNNRKFSVEFKKAIAQMKGIKFAGKKTANKVGDKTYHNLLVTGRLAAKDGKPAKFGPAELNAIDPDNPF